MRTYTSGPWFNAKQTLPPMFLEERDGIRFYYSDNYFVIDTDGKGWVGQLSGSSDGKPFDYVWLDREHGMEIDAEWYLPIDVIEIGVEE